MERLSGRADASAIIIAGRLVICIVQRSTADGMAPDGGEEIIHPHLAGELAGAPEC